MNIKWIGASSNNFDSGRGGKKIDKIVLHWIVGTLESADGTFANPDRKASAHYGIGDNDVHQYVREEDTAWHASNYGVNQTSIGIEHEGGWLLADGTRQKPSDKTHETSGRLVADICRRYSLPINKTTIHTHSEYKATQCPGSLDIDRIIEIAKNFNTPEPPVGNPTEPISDPQAKLVLGKPWGTKELQATISTLNDQQRTIDNNETACMEQVKESVSTAISKNDTEWQKKIKTANDKITELEQTVSKIDQRTLAEYDWKVLMSQAWKNWWKERKGGDSNV